MHRFWVEPESVGAEEIRIEGEELKHLRQVLRLDAGDPVVCIEGSGDLIDAVLASVDKRVALARITGRKAAPTEPKVEVELFQAVAKNDRMDWIVQKAVELGVTRITPVITEHTVVRAEPGGGKRDRWERIAREAVKQCGRARMPVISDPVPLREALAHTESHDVRILLYEAEQKKCLKEILLCYNMSAVRKIALIIGPEGGFSPKEAEFACENGFQAATLGHRILRTETAAVAALSIIFYETGEMNR